MNDTRLRRMGRLPSEGMDAMQSMLAALAPLMIGIRRQATPPLRFGAQRLHRMHVLVMGPHQAFEAPSLSDDLEQVLPRLNRWPAEAKARPILGEILRGEKGEWYERIGTRIRPLRQLVSGPNGEVLEVPSDYVAEDGRGQAPDTEVCEESSDDEEMAVPQPEAREGTQRGASMSAGFRRLIAEPGTWRVLPFGCFKLLLASQLSFPSRLRDSHRIPCHLEVFEAIMPQRIDALARAILGEAAGPTDLQPLTPSLVAQLDLAQLLPAPVRVPPFSPEQGAVRPGQRFFRLVVANDPTAPPPETASASGTVPNFQNEATSAQAPGQGASARATAIPVHLLQPWEFCRSREEAIALLLQSDSWWARMTRPLRRMMHRGALRRWQLFLSGRSTDEQLWSLPPPRGWLGDAWLREWARHTLEAGGYDSAVMLPEWEIFWGRKTRS